jgi:hypothetical protein
VRFSTSGEVASSFVLPIIAFLILMPVIASIMLACKPSYPASLSDLYSDVRENAKLGKLTPLIYFLRRGMLVGSAIFMSGYPGIQVMLNLFFSQLNLTFLVFVKPYAGIQQTMEVLNELCLLLTGYSLLLFTDWSPTYAYQESAGYSFIVILCGNFAINALVQCAQMLWKLYLRTFQIRHML